MKTATFTAVAVYVWCPYCGADVVGPSGSLMITRDDSYEAGQAVTCTACNKKFKMPKVVENL